MNKINEIEIEYIKNDSHSGGTLIDSSNGAENGFCMGISEYFSEEFGELGIHDDQEGFYVIEGKGFAKVGNKEFFITKGDSFIVKAGIKHVLKKDINANVLKVLWSHGAI